MNLTIKTNNLNDFLTVTGKNNKLSDNNYNCSINSINSIYGQASLTALLSKEVYLNKIISTDEETDFLFTFNSNTAGPLVKALEGSETELKEENGKLKLISNDTSILLNGNKDQLENSFFDKLEGIAVTVNFKATDLLKALEQLFKALPKKKETHLSDINNICFDFNLSDGTVQLAAIDGFRLHTKKIKFEFSQSYKYDLNSGEFPENLQVLIDKDNIKILIDTLKRIKRVKGKNNFENSIFFQICNNSVIFYSNDYNLIVPRFTEKQFFDYSQIIPTEEQITNKFSIKKENLLKDLKKLLAVKPTDSSLNKAITIFDFTDKGLTIAAKNSNTKIEIDLNKKIEPKKSSELYVGFDTKYLIESLEKLENGLITFSTSNEIGPCMIEFQENDKNSGFNLVLPVRITG